MNDARTIHDELLMDLEETLEAQGYVPLYDFAWTLRGYDRGLRPDEITTISREVLAELAARVPMRLVWASWPIEIDEVRDAEPTTDLDFDLDHTAPVTTPLLVLVPVQV